MVINLCYSFVTHCFQSIDNNGKIVTYYVADCIPRYCTLVEYMSCSFTLVMRADYLLLCVMFYIKHVMNCGKAGRACGCLHESVLSYNSDRTHSVSVETVGDLFVYMNLDGVSTHARSSSFHFPFRIEQSIENSLWNETQNEIHVYYGRNSDCLQNEKF